MARLTLILSIVMTLIALLGGLRYVIGIVRYWRRTGRWLLPLALCLASPISAQAVTFLTEDYEVANFDALAAHDWILDNGTELDASDTMSIVSCPSGRTGKCLRMQYQGVHVDDNHNAKITKIFDSVNEFYTRYYVRYDVIDSGQASGFTPVTAKQHYYNVAELPNALTNFHWGDPYMAMSSQTNFMHSCPGGGTDVTCNLYVNLASVSMTYGTWRCVETHLGPTSADIWIDGVQTMHYEDPYWVNNSDWHSIQIYRQGADNQYRYEDDFVMATTRVGCESGGGSSLVLILEWAPVVTGVLWHFRHALVSGVMALWLMGTAVLALTAHKTKHLAYTTSLITVQGLQQVLEKVKRT